MVHSRRANAREQESPWHTSKEPVPLVVRLLLRLLFCWQRYLRVDSCEESHGNFGHRVARTGVFADCGQPGRNFLTFRFAGAGNGACRISARHVVTELREAHGPVGADEN